VAGDRPTGGWAGWRPLLAPSPVVVPMDVGSIQAPLIGGRGKEGNGAGAAAGGISALGLVSVGFFWVSGGSYGNEALVLSAPPGMLLFGITVIGLCYGVPLAFITAELGTGWQVAGGMAQWVEIALGETLGAHNAWWVVVVARPHSSLSGEIDTVSGCAGGSGCPMSLTRSATLHHCHHYRTPAYRPVS
jgi:hypothetical protein